MKTIVLTGGGSGGHIAPIRAVAPELMKIKKLVWIGTSNFEKNVAAGLGIEFKKITSGKMRRGLSLKNIAKNIIDIFNVAYATCQSLFFLKKIKPEKVFSTGGFVSVPVVIAAWILHIPVIIHEQTIGFGLANKIAAVAAQKILLAFSESKKYIPEKYHTKVEIVGNPIRVDLMKGSFEKLQKFLGDKLMQEKPILYITGGGQGSQLLNEVVFESLNELIEKFYVIHQAGRSGIEKAKELQTNISANTSLRKNYFPFEFVGTELADIYASADMVIARAGAGTVNELDYFGIYSIFVPLRPVQNDEQMKNAEWFLKKNKGEIIEQAECNTKKLAEILRRNKISKLRRNSIFENKESNSTELILENLK